MPMKFSLEPLALVYIFFSNQVQWDFKEIILNNFLAVAECFTQSRLY